jgi:hypothetical protein
MALCVLIFGILKIKVIYSLIYCSLYHFTYCLYCCVLCAQVYKVKVVCLSVAMFHILNYEIDMFVINTVIQQAIGQTRLDVGCIWLPLLPWRISHVPYETGATAEKRKL